MSVKKGTENGKINSILGVGSSLYGNYIIDGSARVDGYIEGEVEVDGVLVVGATGKIVGNVKAEHAVIGGEVVGNVSAGQKIELMSSARVRGDLSTKVLVIDEKAFFQGRCSMTEKDEAE